MRTLFSTAILFFWAFSCVAQQPELVNDSEFREKGRAAVDSIYNFNFEAADSLLHPWKKEHPDHPLWTLMEGMNFWWEVLSDLEDTSHDEAFFDLMKKADYEASKLLRNDRHHADGLLIKAISNGYIARQYANREEWINSVNQGRKALRAYNYLLEQNPDLADLKLAEGLKLYYSEFIPEEYPVVKTVSWALPDGDKQKGLILLQEAAEESIFAGAEATYFLGNININYEKNYQEAIRHLEELYHDFPRNNFYTRVYVRSLFERRRFDKAAEVIDHSLKRWKNHEYPFGKIIEEELLTWRGRIWSRNGQDEKAEEAYKKVLEISEDLPNADRRSFRMASAYFLGKLYFDKGDTSMAESYLKLAAGSNSNYRHSARELLKKI